MLQGACHPAPLRSRERLQALAPAWHTALLIFLIASVALAGLLGLAPEAAEPTRSRVLGSYLPLCVVGLGLTAYVSRWGFGKNILASLWGRRARGRAASDGLLALGLFAFIISAEHLLGGASSPASALLPQTPLERLAWIGVAIVVGFSEELVYRGYLRKQLGAFCSSAWLGNVAQALLFGVAHLEQGAHAAARIALYGLLLGAVAQWRRCLLPGAVAHVALDIHAGLFG
jgi:membrane protease YdiL (CAAX protease family)